MSPEGGTVTGKAWAKVNLTFEVLGRRPDGYHEVVTVLQAISLCDVMTFSPHRDLRLSCDAAELASPNNLVCRAARLVRGLIPGKRGAASPGPGAIISLRKGIPPASGLGGGSSDAALTLRVLNRMWGAGLGPARLMKAGAELGSDVPFFVGEMPTALATGRGEKVAPLPSLAATWLVLLRPPIELPGKTREMYARLGPGDFTGGEHAARLRDALIRGDRVTNGLCFNAFGPLALSVFPGLAEYCRAFLAAGAGEVHLAGAGPTLFTLVEDRMEGDDVVGRLKRQGLEARLARTLRDAAEPSPGRLEGL